MKNHNLLTHLAPSLIRSDRGKAVLLHSHSVLIYHLALILTLCKTELAMNL